MSATAHARVYRMTTAGLLAIALTYVGCSVDEHYDTLSLFFDGVPEPILDDAETTAPSQRGSRGSSLSTIVSSSG